MLMCVCVGGGVAVVKDFVLIGQHTCPRSAMKEIEQLYAVVKGIQKKWKIDVSQTSISCFFLGGFS